MIIYHWIMIIIYNDYPLVNVYITLENNHV